MRAVARSLVLGSLVLTSGCTSFWEQRHYQKVAWTDGDGSRVEVWLHQGRVNLGPLAWLTDVLATPVLWLADLPFVASALARDDAAIRGGPLGVVVAFLPFFTCMPLDNKPSVWLPLHEPLALTAGDRAELARLGDRGGIEWLALHYANAEPDRAEARAAKVREWVTAVRLAAPPDPGTVRLGDNENR
jgi:hypothetical protein